MENTDLIIVIIRANLKNEQSIIAVQAENSKDTNVIKQEPFPSIVPDAKDVPTLKKKPNPMRRKVATFIVEKYVKDGYINWGRDLKISYKFADKYPDLNFWMALPVKFQVESMVMLWTPKAKNMIEINYNKYILALRMQKSLIIEEAAPLPVLGDKVGEDYQVKEKQRSVLEFCK